MGNEIVPQNIMQMLGAEKNKKQLSALVGKHMTCDRRLALCINSIRRTPKLMECDSQSVLGAMMSSAGLGLEINTPTQQAWLIPYAKNSKVGDKWIKNYECQFQIGYRGFITLAYRSPVVESIEAEAIHENDHFVHMQGSKAFLEFKKTLKNRGDLIGAYCLVKMKDGAEVALVLPLEEIYKAREKSETYKALRDAVCTAADGKDKVKAQKKFDETPWVMWEDDMAAKTVIKRIVKRLPMSSNDPVILAAAMDERPVDYSAMSDEETLRGVFENGYEPPSEEQSNDHDTDTKKEVVQPKSKSEAKREAEPTTTPTQATNNEKVGAESQSTANAEPLSEARYDYLKMKMEQGAIGSADIQRKFGL